MEEHKPPPAGQITVSESEYIRTQRKRISDAVARVLQTIRALPGHPASPLASIPPADLTRGLMGEIREINRSMWYLRELLKFFKVDTSDTDLIMDFSMGIIAGEKQKVRIPVATSLSDKTEDDAGVQGTGIH